MTHAAEEVAVFYRLRPVGQVASWEGRLQNVWSTSDAGMRAVLRHQKCENYRGARRTHALM